MNWPRSDFLDTLSLKNWAGRLPGQGCYLLWENDDLDETDATENKEDAGHISPNTIVNLLGVLQTEHQWHTRF